MAYGFVKQSGGGLSLRSEPGQGTTVLMVLPLTRPQAQPEPQSEEPQLSHSGELVLLVEDDPNVRRVVRQQLVDLGYPVIEAESASQALEMIAQIPDIALMLSDVIMPGGLNGHQLARQVRDERPDMRIVLMSGYTDERSDEKTLPILNKPFVRQDLAHAIQQTTRIET
jgi:CheY-like chemotaxis protein